MTAEAVRVAPHPVKTSWRSRGLRDDNGQPVVQVQIDTPVGVVLLWWHHDLAKAISADLNQSADQAKTAAGGIIVPQMRPPTNGNRQQRRHPG